MDILDGSKKILDIDHLPILPKNGIVVHILPQKNQVVKSISTEAAMTEQQN